MALGFSIAGRSGSGRWAEIHAQQIAHGAHVFVTIQERLVRTTGTARRKEKSLGVSVFAFPGRCIYHRQLEAAAIGLGARFTYIKRTP
jgi:hypothetical protein